METRSIMPAQLRVIVARLLPKPIGGYRSIVFLRDLIGCGADFEGHWPKLGKLNSFVLGAPLGSARGPVMPSSGKPSCPRGAAGGQYTAALL
eukprot:6269505-Pyramimonas_sp.AAC.1